MSGMGDDLDSFKFDVSSTGSPEAMNIPSFNSRLNEIEEEAFKLKSLQDSCENGDKTENSSIVEFSDATSMKASSSSDIDMRSIYIGNVDYTATANEIEQHFSVFGKINRVTIQCDKFSHKPKGYSYIEFASTESVESALSLSDTLFKGRLIKVLPKRTNIPGISSTDRGSRGRSRGRAFRGRGRFSRYNRFRRGPY